MQSVQTPYGQILVRELSLDERPIWHKLWTAYLEFYETKLPSEIIDTTWKRLQDPAEPMYLRGAILNSEIVGIVHYLYHRSCWSCGDYCYLQDLYVVDRVRGRGVGRALINEVEQIARKNGASRIYWLTKEDNYVARALYDHLAERSGFIQYRKLF
jgi:GNAT superfamily N-acetyltransferase